MTTRRALTGNAGDEQQVANAQRKERLNARQAAADMRAVLAMPEGRRVLWDLLGHAQMFQGDWVPDDASAHFAAGRRNEGLYLWARIEAVRPEALLEMMTQDRQEPPDPAPTSKEGTEEASDDES